MKPTPSTRPPRRSSRSRQSTPSLKGDIARAMFARWERDHIDTKPMSWDKFKSTLEVNRLRESRLFAK